MRRIVLTNPVPMRLADALLREYPPQPWELRVLQAVADEGSHPAAARALGISTESAKSAMALVRLKLGARNTTHAVALAIRQGLIR